MSREALVHLAGYSTLALILGTASWSPFGVVFAFPLVFGTLTYAGWRGYQHVLAHAQTATDSVAEATGYPATDGGHAIADTSDAETTGGDRNRQSN